MKAMLLTTIMLCAANSALAGESACSKRSPAHTVALLELYTSEGCSSCPPADRMLGTLHKGTAASGLGIDRLVPLALHVDYWDYIGWKDVYASRTHTERQRWLSALANSRTIYTPEMFIAGKELRDWTSGIPAAVRRINAQPARAQIELKLGKLSGNRLPVEAVAQSASNGKLFLALYENGISTRVSAGENGGVTLHHDHVVRRWVGPIALTASAGGSSAAWTTPLTMPVGSNPGNMGVAAFVQADDGVVLQALALPLCNG